MEGMNDKRIHELVELSFKRAYQIAMTFQMFLPVDTIEYDFHSPRS